MASLLRWPAQGALILYQARKDGERDDETYAGRVGQPGPRHARPSTAQDAVILSADHARARNNASPRRNLGRGKRPHVATPRPSAPAAARLRGLPFYTTPGQGGKQAVSPGGTG